MSKTIKVALAGAGAFGIKHLDGIKNIPDVEVVSVIGRELDKTKEVAQKYGIGHVTTELADSLALPEVDAVILCTPTQMHAAQSIACLKAGKHVQVEIPLADSWKDADEVVKLAKEKGLVAMCGHTRRFNPSLGPAAQLDRPLVVAPRCAHRRFVCLPSRQPDCESQCGARPYPSNAGHCDGHEHSTQGRQRCDLYPQPVVQQRRAPGHLFPLHRRQCDLHCTL